MDFIAEYLRTMYYWHAVEGIDGDDLNRFIEIYRECEKYGGNFLTWFNENSNIEELDEWLENQDLVSYRERILSIEE